MFKLFLLLGLTLLNVDVVSGQTGEPGDPERLVSIRTVSHHSYAGLQVAPLRNGVHELQYATLLDLIGIAYTMPLDRIIGGPEWLEMDQFDVTVVTPPSSTDEMFRTLLRSALEVHFRLAVHTDSKMFPTYALIKGPTEPHLRRAADLTSPACSERDTTGPSDDSGLMVSGANGKVVRLGLGMTMEYACRTLTMGEFSVVLRRIAAASLGSGAIDDETKLEGAWDFEIRWTTESVPPTLISAKDRVSIFEAIDKQLGLKLVARTKPTEILVVDGWSKPETNNVPFTDTTTPMEFDAAAIRPTAYDSGTQSFQVLPGGKLVIRGMPLRFLVNSAFQVHTAEAISGLPGWVDEKRFDVNAEAGQGTLQPGPRDLESMAPMILRLLSQRFGLKYHIEQRQVKAYSLESVNPKLKKAEPGARTWCKYVASPPRSPVSTRSLVCRNVTMAELADRLQDLTPELVWPVKDSTGVPGRWDLAISFVRARSVATSVRDNASASPSLEDPQGGETLFTAISKQLGLKLVLDPRPMPVVVIDQLEQAPTAN